MHSCHRIGFNCFRSRLCLVIVVLCMSSCAPVDTTRPPSAPSLSPVMPTNSPATIIPTQASTTPAIPSTPLTPIALPTQSPAGSASLARIDCPNANTLESIIACVTDATPGKGSLGFIVPDSAAQNDWRSVAAQMLKGNCDTITLPGSLNTYSVKPFTDSANNKKYCVLREVIDADKNGKVDKGWGTFIVNNNPIRELAIAAPHTLADLNTQTEAIGVFKGVDARAYLLAGTHRDANTTRSTCQAAADTSNSDAANNADSMFQATIEQLAAYYDIRPYTVIEFHGMAVDSCVTNVYLSYGVNQPPAADDKIRALKANLLKYHPAWDIAMPGDTPPCDLNATNNVQGRLLNGVAAPDVCKAIATSYSGRFIHIEQDPNNRTASDWIQPIIDTWK
jgi:hypothetical protein